MDIDVGMACLQINEKKRRLTDLCRPSRQPGPRDSSSSDSDNSGEADDQSMNPQLRRSTRRKIRPPEAEKRRVITKPKKLLENSDLTEIMSYYLDKRVKRLAPSLETIYEEPQDGTAGDSLMSKKKFRRLINFGNTSKNPSKIKKRKLKAKALSAPKRQRGKKVTMDYLMKKLSGLEDC